MNSLPTGCYCRCRCRCRFRCRCEKKTDFDAFERFYLTSHLRPPWASLLHPLFLVLVLAPSLNYPKRSRVPESLSIRRVPSVSWSDPATIWSVRNTKNSNNKSVHPPVDPSCCDLDTAPDMVKTSSTHRQGYEPTRWAFWALGSIEDIPPPSPLPSASYFAIYRSEEYPPALLFSSRCADSINPQVKKIWIPDIKLYRLDNDNDDDNDNNNEKTWWRWHYEMT